MKQHLHLHDGMRPGLLLAVLGLLLSFAVAPASAAVTYWEGTNGTAWDDDGNWSGSAPVDNGFSDTAAFAGAVTTNQPIITLATTSVRGLRFESAGWTVSGNSGTKFFLRELNSSGIGTNVVTRLVELDFVAGTWNIDSGNILQLSGGLEWTKFNRVNTIDGGGMLYVTSQLDGYGSTSGLSIDSGTVRVDSASLIDEGILRINSTSSYVEILGTVSQANSLIGTKIQDTTGFGLQAIDIGGGYAQVFAVPEPSTGALLLLGLAGTALRRRR